MQLVQRLLILLVLEQKHRYLLFCLYHFFV